MKTGPDGAEVVNFNFFVPEVVMEAEGSSSEESPSSSRARFLGVGFGLRVGLGFVIDDGAEVDGSGGCWGAGDLRPFAPSLSLIFGPEAEGVVRGGDSWGFCLGTLVVLFRLNLSLREGRSDIVAHGR